MEGKDKCEFLKEIRKNIAKINNILYEPHKCNYDGDCLGTCPLCEKEAEELLIALKEREKQGFDIKTDEYSTMLIEERKINTDDIDETYNQSIEIHNLMGCIKCDEEEEELKEKINLLTEPLMGDVDDSY